MRIVTDVPKFTITYDEYTDMLSPPCNKAVMRCPSDMQCEDDKCPFFRDWEIMVKKFLREHDIAIEYMEADNGFYKRVV